MFTPAGHHNNIIISLFRSAAARFIGGTFGPRKWPPKKRLVPKLRFPNRNTYGLYCVGGNERGRRWPARQRHMVRKHNNNDNMTYWTGERSASLNLTSPSAGHRRTTVLTTRWRSGANLRVAAG